MTQNSDCLECRLVSGFGLIGASLYVLHHGRKFNNTFSRVTITVLGSGLGMVGFLRLTNLPPFKKEAAKVEERRNQNHESNSDYIIGKFPRKFN